MKLPGRPKIWIFCFFCSRDAWRTGCPKMFHLGVDFGSVFGPKIEQKWTKKSQKSGRSGLLVSKVLSVRSFRPVGPVGLVWSRRLGRPGGLHSIQRRPTAPHELVRGGPRWNDPPCPSRCVNSVSSFSLFCWFCCALLCFASFRFALRCVALL